MPPQDFKVRSHDRPVKITVSIVQLKKGHFKQHARKFAKSQSFAFILHATSGAASLTSSSLHRIEQISARDGVPLARPTLRDWIGRISVAFQPLALQPLADRLPKLLRERSYLHADETPVRQLDPGSGKTKHAYLWAYCLNALVDGPSIVVFDY